MQIQSAQSDQSILQTNATQPSQGENEAAAASSRSGDAATSFDEAMRRAAEETGGEATEAAGGGQTTTPAMTEEDLPVEAYALPKWAESWISPLTQVSAELGSNSSWTDSRREQLSAGEEKELAEYTGIVQEYLSRGLRENGVDSTVEYYTDILLNPEKSEKVHQEVREMLAGDPRAMELMEKFHASLD